MKRRSAPTRFRHVVLASVAALVAAVLSPSLVAAGDTRSIYVGDPDGTSAMVIRPTDAVAGERTGISVLVANAGPQSVTHVSIAIGDAAATTPTPPLSPSLPVGWTVDQAYGAGICSLTALSAGASCSIDSLPAQASALVTFIVETPAAGSYGVYASVKVDENTNDNGANTDTFFASGTARVFADDGDHFATYLAPGETGTFGTSIVDSGLGPTQQGANVKLPSTFGGDVALSVIEAADTTTCASDVRCFGSLEQINVADGAPISPYVETTIHWAAGLLPNGFTPNKAGILYLPTFGSPILISVKSDGCTASKAVNCVVGYTSTKTYFELVVRTPENGGMKGFG